MEVQLAEECFLLGVCMYVCVCVNGEPSLKKHRTRVCRLVHDAREMLPALDQ